MRKKFYKGKYYIERKLKKTFQNVVKIKLVFSDYDNEFFRQSIRSKF